MISHYLIAKQCKKSYDDKTFVVNEIEVLIEEINGLQVVAFRGTEATNMFSNGGWLDVIRDLRIAPASYYGLLGHAGFLSGAKAVESELLTRLDRYKPVIVAGHSLGGGLAIPAARMLLAKQFNVTELVTFGAPLCITKGHKQFKNMKVSQYEYGDDICPTLQFYTPRKHFNRLVVGRRRSMNWFFNRTWDDHDINLYVKGLRHD